MGQNVMKCKDSQFLCQSELERIEELAMEFSVFDHIIQIENRQPVPSWLGHKKFEFVKNDCAIIALILLIYLYLFINFRIGIF